MKDSLKSLMKKMKLKKEQKHIAEMPQNYRESCSCSFSFT